MKKLVLAALPIVALACAQPTFADDPVSQAPSANAQAPGASATTEQQGAGVDTNASTPQQQPQQRRAKHPPTAVMDRASPPDKAGTEAVDKGKHPPAKVMERATPELKSPDAASTDASGSPASSSGSSTSK